MLLVISNSDEDEESTLSSLLGELDDIRNSAMPDGLDNDVGIDMDETFEVPPPKAQGVSKKINRCPS